MEVPFTGTSLPIGSPNGKTVTRQAECANGAFFNSTAVPNFRSYARSFPLLYEFNNPRNS